MEAVVPHPTLIELCKKKRKIEEDRRHAINLRKAFEIETQKIHREIQEYMNQHGLSMFLDPETLQPYNVTNQLICGKKPSQKKQQQAAQALAQNNV